MLTMVSTKLWRLDFLISYSSPPVESRLYGQNQLTACLLRGFTSSRQYTTSADRSG
jgi:hypothetical protein